MVSGPEVARLVNEFKCSSEVTKDDQGKKPDCRHHEQRKGVQKALKKQVKSLSTTITEMGNPFQESTNDLLVLDTWEIMFKTSESVWDETNIANVLQKIYLPRSKSLFEPVKQNRLHCSAAIP